jgi:hypothetical protein
VNARQLTFVLSGLLIFVVGAFLGLRPVEGRTSDGAALISPLLDPAGALVTRPDAVLVALLVVVSGPAVALVGCYLARDRS